MNFASDNTAGVSPQIMAAIADANEGRVSSYETDISATRLNEEFSKLFEREVVAHCVATGTAANALALSVLSPPYGVVFCHEDSHIAVDECGAPEFFIGGAKLEPVGGFLGKISPERLVEAIARHAGHEPHHAVPAVLSLSQSTEWGGVYSADELRNLTSAGRDAGLKVHMDGARFANAVAALGSSPADLTWRAGVDVLSFGATKNGAMAAEAVIFFNPQDAGDFAFRRKRGGHLLSKSRYVTAQLLAYLDGNHWLENAAHANEMAALLAREVATIGGIELVWPVEANEVFLKMPRTVASALAKGGVAFAPWGPADRDEYRFVTSFQTTRDEVSQLLSLVRGAANGTV